MNFKKFKENILENLINIAKRQDLTASDWADAVKAYKEAKNGQAFSEQTPEIAAKEYEAEKELILANQRIKNRTLLGSELKLLQEWETILGENRPSTPILTLESNKVYVGTNIWFTFTKSNSDIYNDDQITYEAVIKTIEGNFKVIPAEKYDLRPEMRVGCRTEWVAGATGDTIVSIAIRAVSPSGMVSGNSNSFTVRIINSRFIGFFQNCTNHTARRIGSNSIEDNIWLPNTVVRLNEFHKDIQPNPIDDLLDRADYLPYKYMKRYIIKYNRDTGESWVDTSDLNNGGKGLGKVDTSKAATDDPNSKINRLRALDPKTYNIMVRIPRHYEIDIKFEWNGDRYYFKAVSMEPFELDIESEGFKGATNLHGRAEIDGTIARAVVIDEFWIAAFRSTLVENRYCVSNLANTVIANLNANNCNTARVSATLGTFRTWTQNFGAGYKVHNYIQVRTIALLIQCERGMLGDKPNYFTFINQTAPNTNPWNKYWASEPDINKKCFTRSRWCHAQDESGSWASQNLSTLLYGDESIAWWNATVSWNTITLEHIRSNYRGIEHWTGDLWIGVDGCTMLNGQFYVAEANTEYVDGKITDNYKPVGKICPRSNGDWVKELQAGEILPETDTGIGGSQTIGLTTRFWNHSNYGAPQMFYQSGRPDYGNSSGWLGSLGLCGINMHNVLSYSAGHCGSRLSLSKTLDMP